MEFPSIFDAWLAQLEHICFAGLMRPRQPVFVIISRTKKKKNRRLHFFVAASAELSVVSPPSSFSALVFHSLSPTLSTCCSRDGKQAESRNCGGGRSTCSLLSSSLVLFSIDFSALPIFGMKRWKAHPGWGADMELLLLVRVLQPPLGPGFPPTQVPSVALV